MAAGMKPTFHQDSLQRADTLLLLDLLLQGSGCLPKGSLVCLCSALPACPKVLPFASAGLVALPK
eukprot:11096437-Karenia_brevis.AAC.1